MAFDADEFGIREGLDVNRLNISLNAETKKKEGRTLWNRLGGWHWCQCCCKLPSRYWEVQRRRKMKDTKWNDVFLACVLPLHQI